jgi:SecD/SecF fusion protein
MPDRDEPLDLLGELRDVGVTTPPPEVLRARVSSAIAEEIERESASRPGESTSGPPDRSTRRRFGGARRRRGHARLTSVLVPVVGVLLVALVLAVFVGLHRSGPSGTVPGHSSAAPGHGSVVLVYLAEPTPEAPTVNSATLERTVEIIQERLRALGISGMHVTVSSANQITVTLPSAKDRARAEQVLVGAGRVYFYDWEANVLTPNGKAVASQLLTQDPTAIEISQGSGSSAPGSPGAGSMGLYQAVVLASKQPYSASASNSRLGSQYYIFGAPGSRACATAAHDQGQPPVVGVHCLLSGPDDDLANLDAGLPAGVTPSQGQTLAVKRGTVVLEAVSPSFAQPVPFGDPNAQFFVLKDNVALSNNNIANPQETTESGTGQPDVTFAFSSKGKSEFQSLTGAVTHRGQLVSSVGQTLDQHFAIALDSQLITVPSIDFKTYPDGIPADAGADIVAGFTGTSARDLAAELRVGALPLSLKLICAGTPATTTCGGPRVG